MGGFNHNSIEKDDRRLVMFVDMNSYFASCEQQVNPALRGVPIAVGPYDAPNSPIIAPSIEAKKRGVKTGMRMREARKLCPELIACEIHSDLYRDFHVKIMNVLRRYCDDVIPKSVDEAIIDLTNYRLVYKDPLALAEDIRRTIKADVGDWLKCSIGIAPNAFLAKLGSDIKKPEGTTVIMPDNIDEVLKTLHLTDLPGIAESMAFRLQRGGIHTPLDLRHADPAHLQRICRSVVGLHWHYRLNFGEIDMRMERHYKHMQAMRHVSFEQRSNPETLKQILLTMCMVLEGRMVKQGVYAQEIYVNFTYANKEYWHDKTTTDNPLQDGIDLHRTICRIIERYEKLYNSGDLINTQVTALGVGVSGFVKQDTFQYSLFDSNARKDILRKTVYTLKNRFGKGKVIRAAELVDVPVYKDLIGFGNIKDMYVDGE